ncbi:NADH-quinone oxidoreductase subunit NuoE [Sedimentibacter sp. zth1]|uniref:NADH-quinone oxidoreductase subunit NuoE n=1 Tax=Sedimentibacter sp. zth1 TaxID=2816908 RepID=UPI001A919235|nr:NADH-quinone oxidoreductase subunit NuoE [Sedimentibacter sp. zth1]
MQDDFSVEEKKKEFLELKNFIDSIDNHSGSLMQILHKAQEIFGYLPFQVQKFISEKTNIPISEIYGVATFYTQFTINPKGKHKIGVCLGTACYVRNSQAILEKIMDELKIKVGETTSDNLFTLDATRCLGCCGLAPVMMIDDEVYGKVDPSKVPEILNSYK